MKINLIIGAGQLGSRHLQGLLKVAELQEIFVLDPSEESLNISRERAAEIPHKHTLRFIATWDSLPATFDLVIVATGASVRAKIVTQLLEQYSVKNLVLEKILFQDIASYDQIRQLIEKTGTPTWVNHPRRMAQHFREIREILSQSREQVVFHTVGSNWGLACNALHFIDLCAFLTNSALESLNTDMLDNTIHASKRNGCIEFTGSMTGKMEDGSTMLISSIAGDLGDITIYVSAASNRWIIQEGRAQKVVRLSKENGFNEEIIPFTTEFQSSLTTKVAAELFRSDRCDLPTYDEACQSHIPFIKASLEKYNKLSGVTVLACPIT